MNWDSIAGNWKQITGKVKAMWGKLTDDDHAVQRQPRAARGQDPGALRSRQGPSSEGRRRLAQPACRPHSALNERRFSKRRR